MSQSDILLIVVVILPLIIFSLRRGWFIYLLTFLMLWAVWIMESWHPKADNNWGAATIGVGWILVAVYCSLCYAVTGLFRRACRKVAGTAGDA